MGKTLDDIFTLIEAGQAETLNAIEALYEKLEALEAQRDTTQETHGASPLYMNVLQTLKNDPDTWFRPGQLTKLGVGSGPQQVGAVLKKMVRRGLVERREEPAEQSGYVPTTYKLRRKG